MEQHITGTKYQRWLDNFFSAAAKLIFGYPDSLSDDTRIGSHDKVLSLLLMTESIEFGVTLKHESIYYNLLKQFFSL